MAAAQDFGTRRVRAQVRRIVRTVRGLWMACEAARFAAWAAAALAAWFLLVAGLDNLAILGSAPLLGAWLVLAAAAALWLGLAVARIALRPPSADRCALMYEARLPGFRNRLINSLQFIEDGRADTDPLARAAVLENAAHLGTGSTAAALERRPLLRAAAALAAAALLLGAYVAAAPGWAANAWSRLCSPLSPPAHLLATRIAVEPGDAEVPEGGSLLVQATLAGRIPGEATIQYRRGEGNWVEAAMEPLGPGRFRFVGLSGLDQPVVYRVLAGRSRSPDYLVSIRFGPRIQRLRASLVRPAYAGATRTAFEPNRGDIAGLAGSQVSLRITADHPLRACRLDLRDADPVHAEIDSADPRSATAAFALEQSGAYTVHVTDTEGLPNSRVPRYALTVLPDQAPAVSVVEPARDLILPVDAKADLTVSVSDDIGLGKVILQARFGDGVWSEHRTWNYDAPDTVEDLLAHTLDLAALEMEPEQTLLYRVVAFDRREPSPNRSVGRTWSITAAAAAGSAAVMRIKERKRLVDLLEQILALQRENRARVQGGGEQVAVRAAQEKVRDLTIAAAAEEEKTSRPNHDLVKGLRELAHGEMLLSVQSARSYESTPSPERRAALSRLMDRIIDRLQELLKQSGEALVNSTSLKAAAERMTPGEREQMVEEILAEMERLEAFTEQKEQMIEDVKRMLASPEAFRPDELERLDLYRHQDDQWGQVFAESMTNMERLVSQDFADNSILEDYEELVEHLDESEEALANVRKPGAAATSKGGDFKFVHDTMLESHDEAVEAQQKLEEFLATSDETDRTVQQESAMTMEIDDTNLPEELYDMAGELAEESAPLQASEEQEQEYANYWTDPPADEINPEWDIDDGPTADFSPQSFSGDKLPDDNLISGRAGDGRAGRSAGQTIDTVSKGLPGREPPTRLTDDPFEEGVLRELRKREAGGSTGGGKVAGESQEGLQGNAPPPEYKGLGIMRDWRRKMQEKMVKEATPVRAARVGLPHEAVEYARLLQLLREADAEPGDSRYEANPRTEDMTLPSLMGNPRVDARQAYRHVEPAYPLPDDVRQRVLDAANEPVPEEYDHAQQRYFKRLSENDSR